MRTVTLTTAHAAGLVAIALVAATAFAAPTSPASTTHRTPPAGASLPSSVSFSGVAAISASDVWAVGYTVFPRPPNSVAEHWDGARWSRVSLPLERGSRLYGVSATSASDVWAVGWIYAKQGRRGLVMHWDGTSWSEVKNSDGSGDSLELTAVSADSPTDAWAVGDNDLLPYSRIIEHWDGTSWSHVSMSDPTNLYDVLALSPTDAWLVGNSARGSGSGDDTATYHWDGHILTRISSPNGDRPFNALFGIDGDSSDDVWTVGGASRAMMAHWDGTTWTRTFVHRALKQFELQTTDVVSPTDVWAAGLVQAAYPKMLHWDGATWAVVATPAVPGGSTLNGIDSVTANDAWAVGSTDQGSATSPLIWHWDGTQWSDMS